MGSISVGKLANFVILPIEVDGDLEKHRIRDAKAEQT